MTSPIAEFVDAAVALMKIDAVTRLAPQVLAPGVTMHFDTETNEIQFKGPGFSLFFTPDGTCPKDLVRKLLTALLAAS